MLNIRLIALTPCTPVYIREKFDISPSQYADFKSLVGDTADNIKGVNKVGPKTSAVLLKEYGSLQNILDNAEKISRVSIRDSILTSIERAAKNYKLIKLQQVHKLPFDLRELEFEDRGIIASDVLRGIGLK